MNCVRKRKLNVKRLKEGLLEYNEENKKDYKNIRG